MTDNGENVLEAGFGGGAPYFEDSEFFFEDDEIVTGWGVGRWLRLPPTRLDFRLSGNTAREWPSRA